MRALLLMAATWRATGTPSPGPVPSPVPMPTALPIPAPSAAAATPVPSARPTHSGAPSPAPSISCRPDESIYRFRMYDSGCDGWQLTHYIVYNSSAHGDYAEGVIMALGTLDSGCEGADWMCLRDGCYELVVSGGYNLDEVSFDFRDQAERHFDGGRHFQDLSLDDATNSYQDHFCVEDGDLFHHPTAHPTVSPYPSPLPTVSPPPSVTPRPSGAPTPPPTQTPTTPPSAAPTSMPTPAPTPMPSPDCPGQHERHYRIRMSDSGGDGWQGPTYVIRESALYGMLGEGNITATGTLASGAYGVDWLCLVDGCYELEIADNGVAATTLAEISFEFQDEGGLHFQDLAAPYHEHFCVARGDLFEHPTAQPTVTPMPSPLPTVSPYPTISPHPTQIPTATPTPAPSMPPTPLPTISPMPTPVPTISSHPTISQMPTPLPTPLPTVKSTAKINVSNPFRDWPLVFGIAFTCLTLLIVFVVCLYAPMCPLYGLIKGAPFSSLVQSNERYADVELPAFSSSLVEDRARGAPGGGRRAAKPDSEPATETHTSVPNPFQPAAAFTAGGVADRCEKEHAAGGDEAKAGPPPAPAPSPADATASPMPTASGFSNFDSDFDPRGR